jgi:MFS family permease
MALSWTLTAIIIVVILMGPSLLQSLFAVPAKTALIANAAGTLCLCLSTAALGFLSDRFGLRRVLGPALLLSIATDYLLYSSTYRTVPNGTLLFTFFAGIGAGAVVLTQIVRVRSFPRPLELQEFLFPITPLMRCSVESLLPWSDGSCALQRSGSLYSIRNHVSQPASKSLDTTPHLVESYDHHWHGDARCSRLSSRNK